MFKPKQQQQQKKQTHKKKKNTQQQNQTKKQYADRWDKEGRERNGDIPRSATCPCT